LESIPEIAILSKNGSSYLRVDKRILSLPGTANELNVFSSDEQHIYVVNEEGQFLIYDRGTRELSEFKLAPKSLSSALWFHALETSNGQIALIGHEIHGGAGIFGMGRPGSSGMQKSLFAVVDRRQNIVWRVAEGDKFLAFDPSCNRVAWRGDAFYATNGQMKESNGKDSDDYIFDLRTAGDPPALSDPAVAASWPTLDDDFKQDHFFDQLRKTCPKFRVLRDIPRWNFEIPTITSVFDLHEEESEPANDDLTQIQETLRLFQKGDVQGFGDSFSPPSDLVDSVTYRFKDKTVFIVWDSPYAYSLKHYCLRTDGEKQVRCLSREHASNHGFDGLRGSKLYVQDMGSGTTSFAHFFDVSNGKWMDFNLDELSGASAALPEAVDLSLDGKRLAMVVNGKLLIIEEIDDGKPKIRSTHYISEKIGGTDLRTYLKFVEPSKVVIVRNNGTVSLFDITAEREVWRSRVNFLRTESQDAELRGTELIASEDGATIAIRNDRKLQMIDAATGFMLTPVIDLPDVLQTPDTNADGVALLSKIRLGSDLEGDKTESKNCPGWPSGHCLADEDLAIAAKLTFRKPSLTSKGSTIFVASSVRSEQQALASWTPPNGLEPHVIDQISESKLCWTGVGNSVTEQLRAVEPSESAFVAECNVASTVSQPDLTGDKVEDVGFMKTRSVAISNGERRRKWSSYDSIFPISKNGAARDHAIFPVKGKVVKPFGVEQQGRAREVTVFASQPNEDVTAIERGEVDKVDMAQKTVGITHSGEFQSEYIGVIDAKVQLGQLVDRGQVIGVTPSSAGDEALELKFVRKGQTVDPLPYLGHQPPPLAWPVLRSSPRTAPVISGGGLAFAVPIGTAVHASEAGTVRFADELKEYGQLMIIQHDPRTITVYAHNSVMLVKAGDQVKRGEVISRTGKSGAATEPILYFEVRRDNSAVNALEWLEGENFPSNKSE